MITSTTNAPSTTAAAAGAASATVPGGAMGKDQFLKLLIAQMKNQDPMSPMQGDQMAAQLAQFSSLEQLQQINATLTDQQTATGGLLGAIQGSAAINTIGHTVIALGNQVQIGGANGSTSVTAGIAGASASGTIHIFNSAGAEVATQTLGATQGGKQTFDIGNATKGLPAGTYTYSIDAKDAGGTALTVQTYSTGKVDGVSTGQNGLVLTAGGLTIPYGDVVQIIN
ncbi:MAG TPA: flagellar hook capping FlgD N-terminal domain-containing protein [Gemmatimonadaceae bacterium]|nr:flagellar hook capping FlgD N-terminal domain-containing protein [Gemmatimonadaceae bacterium]